MIRTRAYIASAALWALTTTLHAQAPVALDNSHGTKQGNANRNLLVGSWIIAIIPDVWPGGPASTGYVLHMNSSDGSMINIGGPLTSSLPAIQNLGNQISGAVGEWVSLGNRQFMETIVALIFKDGVPGGFQRTRTTITID